MSSLFTDEDLTNLEINNDNQPVTVLGKSFANDNERRQYFRDELRKKLPELKKLEGYPIGEDDDIINLSDPPYYTACPNPWLKDFVAEWEKEKESPEFKKLRKDDFEVKDPYASDVSEGKNNPIYNAHSYHTKVPHPAIMRYILHYTQPGDIVLDGFAGTGMTGVAAQMCGKCDIDLKNKIEAEFEKLEYKKPVWGARHAVLGDLSPIASFIAYNYNTPVNAKRFELEAKKILAEVEKKCGWMYETRHTDGSIGKINYVVWSDNYICNNCGADINYYKATVTRGEKKATVTKTLKCAKCGAIFQHADLKKKMVTTFDKFSGKSRSTVEHVPVLINYCLEGKSTRYEKEPDTQDLEIIKKIEELNCDWIPHNLMMNKGSEWGDTWRAGYHIGIENVSDFYEKRTLYILSKLYSLIGENKNIRFVFTSMLPKLTKLNRYMPQHGSRALVGPLANTLYYPPMHIENEVLSQFEFQLKKICKAFELTDEQVVNINSATNSYLKENSIDYIFVDPPFGENIMYSELNYISESWLKVKTNNKKEAIQNNSQQKGIFEYQGLMTEAFRNFYSYLKPGKWITVEFSNTSSAVWNTIRSAINKAGFIIANVSAINKERPGLQGMVTSVAVNEDLVISCYKPSETFSKQFMIQDSRANTWSFVSEHLEHLPIPAVKNERTTSVIERSPKVLYDRLITYFFMRGLPVPLDAADFQEGLRNRYIQEDGMIFTSAQLNQYHELKKRHNITDQPSLFVSIIESENDAIQWIKEKLEAGPLKYQDIQPDYRKAYTINRKGEVEVELKDVLEENFIQEADGSWRIPDMNEQKDRDALRTKALLKIWEDYCAQVESGKVKKLKDVRLEAVKAGFKNCYQKKDFKRIVTMGDKIPENLLTEDETLLNYYDIASSKV